MRVESEDRVILHALDKKSVETAAFRNSRVRLTGADELGCLALCADVSARDLGFADRTRVWRCGFSACGHRLRDWCACGTRPESLRDLLPRRKGARPNTENMLSVRRAQPGCARLLHERGPANVR